MHVCVWTHLLLCICVYKCTCMCVCVCANVSRPEFNTVCLPQPLSWDSASHRICSSLIHIDWIKRNTQGSSLCPRHQSWKYKPYFYMIRIVSYSHCSTWHFFLLETQVPSMPCHVCLMCNFCLVLQNIYSRDSIHILGITDLMHVSLFHQI